VGELPIRDMTEDDELYLYFSVTPNVVLTRYNIGQTEQSIDPPLVAERR